MRSWILECCQEIFLNVLCKVWLTIENLLRHQSFKQIRQSLFIMGTSHHSDWKYNYHQSRYGNVCTIQEESVVEVLHQIFNKKAKKKYVAVKPIQKIEKEEYQNTDLSKVKMNVDDWLNAKLFAHKFLSLYYQQQKTNLQRFFF